MHFTELIDLAAERLGGTVLIANDEFFAPKENLLKAAKPVFIEGQYTDRGKWMDGWETRRRRTPGHDWCIIRLGLTGVIQGVVVDTTHFKGNYPEHCSIEACAGMDQLGDWKELLPKSELHGDSENLFRIEDPHRYSHLRLNIHPDGGVARLRVYGEVVPDWRRLGREREIDLAAVENGGFIVASSDMFFGSRNNLIMPGRATNMSDGWETRRRRGTGHDWVVIKLATCGAIRGVEVDTSHFKGNAPESCSLEACDADGNSRAEILARTPLQPHARHFFDDEIRDAGPVTHVRFNIFPDGGVSRLRLIGAASMRGLLFLNALSREQAAAELLKCCGSTKWAAEMAAGRPFRDLLETADRIWWDLDRQDWLEAFRQHPKIGERAASRWSQEEQAGTAGAGSETLAALAEANRVYEAKFGYVFIVCATGKSADEMLAILQRRLGNDPDTEIRIAAEEQGKITRLRLEKLLAP